jgi:hypothetical protein
MNERIFSRQFHAVDGAEAWRVLPEGADAFLVDVATNSAPDQAG